MKDQNERIKYEVNTQTHILNNMRVKRNEFKQCFVEATFLMLFVMRHKMYYIDVESDVGSVGGRG